MVLKYSVSNINIPSNSLEITPCWDSSAHVCINVFKKRNFLGMLHTLYFSLCLLSVSLWIYGQLGLHSTIGYVSIVDRGEIKVAKQAFIYKAYATMYNFQQPQSYFWGEYRNVKSIDEQNDPGRYQLVPHFSHRYPNSRGVATTILCIIIWRLDNEEFFGNAHSKLPSAIRILSTTIKI